MAQMVKNLPAMQETVFCPPLERPPGERTSNPLQYSHLENPHGQRTLAGYSAWDCKELDTIEQTKQTQVIPGLSSRCSIVASCSPSISRMVGYVCQCHPLSLSHTLLPSLRPQVCSLHLYPYSCLQIGSSLPFF